MKDLEKFLAEAEARCEATNGLYLLKIEARDGVPVVKLCLFPDRPHVFVGELWGKGAEELAQFVVNARTDIPKLIAHIRSLSDLVEKKAKTNKIQIAVNLKIADRAIKAEAQLAQREAQLNIAKKALEYIREDGSTKNGKVVNHSAIKADEALAEIEVLGQSKSEMKRIAIMKGEK